VRLHLVIGVRFDRALLLLLLLFLLEKLAAHAER
jgi:hypothetical protein